MYDGSYVKYRIVCDRYGGYYWCRMFFFCFRRRGVEDLRCVLERRN